MALIPGLFPVYVAKRGTQFPNGGTFFIVAANGAFVHKDFGHWEGLVPMPLKDVPGSIKVGYTVNTKNGGTVYIAAEEAAKKTTYSWTSKDDDDTESLYVVDAGTGKRVEGDDRLMSVEPYINVNLPKIDAKTLYKALLFFRSVYNEHHAEAIVLITYKEEDQTYSLFCPNQKVSSAHLDYDREFAQRLDFVRDNEDPDWVKLLQEGYIPVGTIHSHCNFQAFHSGTDTADEASFNGVHITLGHVVSAEFSVSSSLALNDYRELVDIENVALGMKRVGDAKAASSTRISTGFQNYYQFDMSPEEKQYLKDEFEKDIKENWMPKVEHQSFFQGWKGGTTNYGVGGYGYYSSPSGGGVYSSEGNEGIPPGGKHYILVNGVWVEEDGDEDLSSNLVTDTDEERAADDVWAGVGKDDDTKDIPDMSEWLDREKKAGRDPGQA